LYLNWFCENPIRKEEKKKDKTWSGKVGGQLLGQSGFPGRRPEEKKGEV